MRLVTPTFFVIITAVQIHYFHKDFIELSHTVPTNAATDGNSQASSAQGGLEEKSNDDESDLDLTRKKF